MYDPRAAQIASFCVPDAVLNWYDRHRRDLPWRAKPPEQAEPYAVWLSEIMLQQTTVAAVKPYYSAFLTRWPSVIDLAAAPIEEVMREWAGLGYYSRARNLKACANEVAAMPGGFPDTVDGLRALPGIGAYTAAAIAAIAFDRPAAVVDGNVERVTARLFDIRKPLPDAKTEIRCKVEKLVPDRRPGDFAQAMMDLGATICTPRRPRCMLCPLRADCRALASGDPELLPLRAPKSEKPKRIGKAYVAFRSDGAILMRTRPDKGLLGGMTEVPSVGWSEGRGGLGGDANPPLAANWQRAGTINHVFTHFSLDLDVYRAEVGAVPAPHGHRWVGAKDISGEALPTVMKKAIELAIPGATKSRQTHER
jgi:A/G-specific adenine glycosylase